MPLTQAEWDEQAKAKTLDQVRLVLAAQRRRQWWATVQELATAADIHLRRAQLQLAALTSDGVFERKWSGKGTAARFRLAATAIESIVVTAIESIVVPRSSRSWSSAAPTRRTQARDHARQRSDLPLDPRSMDNTVRPSGGVQGGEPATGGRTEVEQGDFEKRLQSAIAWVQERQGIAPEMSTAGLTRLLNAGASDHELRAYVVEVQRGSHSCLDGLETARFRFGSACTAKRFAIWRASRVRRARGPSVREQVERELERELDPTAMPAPDEMTAIAELVKARMK